MAAICATAQQRHFDGNSWWRYVGVLAADDMEGRATGSPGLDRAEAYIVNQLKTLGLAPSGTKGYFQPLSLQRREILDNGCIAALVRDGRVEPLAQGEDAACTTVADIPPGLEAPLVFLGYGIKTPEKGYDDFAGLDLQGKIAVTTLGSPNGVDAPPDDQRWQQFRDAGLIGWILLANRSTAYASEPRLHLPGALDDTYGQQMMMYFKPARADKLFNGTGHTAAELLALAADRKPLPRFSLPVSVRVRTRMVNTRVETANVVAKLEGSDPRLRNEYVVLSAHIDHVGMGRPLNGEGNGGPVNGDDIYNGALDDASGCAALLDIAAALKKAGVHPKRSVLFVFFTGEEVGQLGSKYFAAHSPVPLKSIIAELNVDTIHAFVPLTQVGVFGLEESDLGDAARRAAASQNIAAAPARPPLWSAFGLTGDDDSSFVLRGIPAIRLVVDFPGEQSALLEKWRRDVYHTPSDDVHQPVNLDTAAKYEEIMMQLLIDVASDPHRPQWKSNSSYRQYARN
jgi:hypothetical protein